MASKPKPKKPDLFTEQFWKRPGPQPKGDDDPKLIYQAVGVALTQWEHVDQRLADLFLAFTSEPSADDATKRAIRRAYGSIISTAGRREAIRAASEIHCVPLVVSYGLRLHAPDLPESKDIENELVDVLNAAQWAAKLRDDIAHGAVREDIEVVTRRNDEIIKEEKFGSFLMPPEYNTGRTLPHHDYSQGQKHLAEAYRARYCYNGSDINGIKMKFYELLVAVGNCASNVSEYVEKRRTLTREFMATASAEGRGQARKKL
jgi:hypothetical protein